jgi:hypothetical protein
VLVVADFPRLLEPGSARARFRQKKRAVKKDIGVDPGVDSLYKIGLWSAIGNHCFLNNKTVKVCYSKHFVTHS